jgi:TatD DNase family protein
MIDTHAHITRRFCDPAVAGQAVEGAKEAGVKAIVLAASNLEESGENIKLAERYPGFLFPAVGIHPQQTDPENKLSIEEQIGILDKLIKDNKVAAIGECGLDYSPAPPEERERSREDQENLFRGQIKLAKEYGLPLMIHARKAVDEVIEILKNYPGLKGVFHCYTGGKKRIGQILELGDSWYFGFDGNLTYEIGLMEVVKNIPIEKVLLETDSPFLAPIPHRGETNRPEYVKYIYEKFNGEQQQQINENARRLFNLNSR